MLRATGTVEELTTRRWRDVPMTATAVEALRGQAVRRRELFGDEPDASELVCSRQGSTGRYRSSRTLSNRWPDARAASPLTLSHSPVFAAKAMLKAAMLKAAMLKAAESYRTVPGSTLRM